MDFYNSAINPKLIEYYTMRDTNEHVCCAIDKNNVESVGIPETVYNTLCIAYPKGERPDLPYPQNLVN